MDMNDPRLVGLLFLGGCYFAWLWLKDRKAWRAAGHVEARGALPGATDSPLSVTLIAVSGALVLLAAETAGEIALGISGEQSTITIFFGLYSLVAAVIEEVIFRGYIVVDKRGRGWLIGSILAASVLFAIGHPFLWKWEEGALIWNFGLKGWFSTFVVFLSSLWFYAVRFASWNPHRSLLPCIAAHGAKNLGVFIIKAAQGFVSGWW
ncbi:CPBP family intramembrane glutamic endopeptidase [Geminisphaera colitermitum]|uniref:CPBP family intramembrane glutamic endopeptidase n=1 Tax=Geminisphaera colitermitum TaxID=1148786 RepID=UPI000158CD33|nr:CPBP family intramembrane glutamic endopeptidase [Geminisphaera colitermitum]